MSDEKKLFVDEDWKSQVEREKSAAKETAASEPGGVSPRSEAETVSSFTPPADAGGSPSSGSDVSRDADPPMPPASFGMLLSSLATEAMLSLGQFPHPATGKTETRRNQAKYLIDTLAMLKEKTAGNLSADEAHAIEDVLHQLRMAFVATK